ncbi:MAG: hypothetical protein JXA95_11585 [Spirochaetales bacterium]|nr:hypothetical protein [Spirochaetales bacterium]
MVKKEITEKSPLRKLESAVQGGLGAGNIGVIASKKGIGKTAALVHIATDKLMQDKHVIHVSYSNRVDHIISWYEDIFSEISKKRDLADAMDVHDELIRNRVIMNFNQSGVTVDHVLAGVKAMMEAGQKGTDAIIIDGFDFTKAADGDISSFKKFAGDNKVEIWFSDSYIRNEGYQDEQGIPVNLKPFLEDLSVVLTLKNEEGFMMMTLIKDHEKVHAEKLSLKLDIDTLLIAEA